VAKGGKRAGAGRKPSATSFRQWCKDVWADPVVQENLLARAKESPEFALKIAEHGFGRPPQALQISGEVSHNVHREIVIDENGQAPFTDTTPLSDYGPN